MATKEDEDSVIIKMQIDNDWKGFEFRLDSTVKMTTDDILLAIECWLKDSILHEYQYNNEPQ